MLISYMMDHDINVWIYVHILLSYLQPVYLSDQSHLILDHQPSPQTLFVSYVYFDKN